MGECSGGQHGAFSAQFAFPGFGKPQKVVCLGFAKTGMTAGSSKLIRHGTMRMHFRFVKSKGCAIRKRRNEGRNGTVLIRSVGARNVLDLVRMSFF